jgi:L,D-transpeptidase YcbB
VLNPTWSVPPSIATRETYYQALKNPNYLSRNGYRVYRNDTLVDPNSIDWKKYKAEKLPFRFVQRPGEGNALGKIKFIFDNPFDIYLHDTPKRKPFGYATRTVSHGCIRLEKPMELVRFLFEGHSVWSPESIRDYIANTSTTKNVMLDYKVPIWVDYFTCWVDDDGRIQFRDDVYSKDNKLKKAMAAYR